MVAGVRGTEYTVAIADDGSSWVDVDEGAVAVSAGAGETQVGKGNAAAVELGADAATAKPSSDQEITSWLDGKEKEFAADPPGVMKKMEGEMREATESADKVQSDVRFAKIGEEENMEDLNKSYSGYAQKSRDFQRMRAANEGLYACTESALEKPEIQANAGKSRMVIQIRKTIQRHHDAMAKLEKRIADAFAKIDQKYNEASERISKRYDEKGKQIGDKYKSYEGSGLMDEGETEKSGK
jgi:ornithine carbamoyltransferase